MCIRFFGIFCVCVCVCVYIYIYIHTHIYTYTHWDILYIHIYIQVAQELRSLFRDLIPELILSQKVIHTHMGPIRNGSGVMSF